MSTADRSAGVAFVLMAALATAAAAEKKEFRYIVGPGATITVANQFGPITLRPSSGKQVLVQATPASDKVEVHSDRAGNRIEVRSHSLAKATPEETSVQYEIHIPAGATVSVRSAGGAITADKISGDLTLQSDTGPIEIRQPGDSHVRVRTIGAPITLSGISNSHVEVSSVTGDVNLTDVSGPRVSVNTTSGDVQYQGGFTVPGEYLVTTHSGGITVAMPEKASVEITAQSAKGTVEDGFQFQPQEHPTIAVAQGRSFAGTVNSGAAAVRLRSFSGNIRVTKQ